MVFTGQAHAAALLRRMKSAGAPVRAAADSTVCKAQNGSLTRVGEVRKMTKGATVKRETVLRLLALGSLVGAALCTGGCDFMKTDSSRLMDPSRVLKAPNRGMPVMNIRGKISAVDMDSERVPGATSPREGDWQYSDADYVIGPGDIVAISILDLYTEGLETVLQRQVSESGYIDLPLLTSRIQAEKLNKEGLKEAIIRAYSPDILREAVVSITILAQRKSTFSILGAVGRTGQYNIVRRDMRLLEAIALAGGIFQSNIRYIYVIRQTPPMRSRESKAKPAAAETTTSTAPSKVPAVIAPIPQESTPKSDPDDAQEALRKLGAALGGKPETPEPGAGDEEPVTKPSTQPATQPATTAPAGNTPDEAPQTPAEKKPQYDWIISPEGELVAVPREKSPTTKPGDTVPPEVKPSPIETDRPADPFGWERTDISGTSRIIAIDVHKLGQGSARMNIVIRDKDVIRVPPLTVGEFYIMGEVNRPGAYQLTGRKMTVRMAIAAASNLGPLAWPKNSMLTRRVGENEEQTIPLNIERILRGQDEDIYLKPNDVLAVGTDIRAPFLAVLRNAFRVTYGLGFIYDRNFAFPLNSTRFKRW